jgi:5-methyltetrahydropteroyltriglutamate--homocysteine methyltransferase
MWPSLYTGLVGTSSVRIASPGMTPLGPGRPVAYMHGIYPRSEDVVQATRDVERGRTTPERVDDAYRRDRQAFLDLQQRAGLDLFSDGLLRWQDLFRPLVDGSEGLDARVLVRWFDNNSFFRAPELSAEPTLRGLPGWALEDGIPGPRAATLPSPYLFSRASRGADDADRMMGVLARDVLGPAARELSESGHGLIHLEEPWLAFFGIEDRSWAPFAAALETVRDAAGGTPVALHLYYGDAAPHAERLVRLPVDAVGVDFAETDLDDLPAPWPLGLVAGCLDGRRSVIEPVEDVVAFVGRVRERLEPPALYLSSGSDLELLGPQMAGRKVEVLGEAARRLREAA